MTWLQDANYAWTSGVDGDGLMNWSVANTWAANLDYHDSVRKVDYSDWRLPAVTDTGTPGCNYSNNGTDCGYNSTGSELAHMYYNDLGLKGFYSTTGVFQPTFGVHGNGTFGGQAYVGPIDNLQSGAYWSGTAYAPDAAGFAWGFGFDHGHQGNVHQFNEYRAWAVRPGDVAAVQQGNDVPEPGSMMLAGLGKGALAMVRRRRSFGAS